MTCRIIALKHKTNHNVISRLLQKYGLILKDIQKDLPRYYVYVHSYNGEVFYVGSAQGDTRRMWNLHKRSVQWYDFVENIEYNYDAEIIEICDNRNQSASREKFWGQYYRDIGKAHLYFEDLRGDKNPSKLKENKDKISKSRIEHNKEKYEHYANDFVVNENLTQIINTGRNRKQVLQLLNDEVIAEYESISNAARAVNADRSLISRACLNGNLIRGFKWEFK